MLFYKLSWMTHPNAYATALAFISLEASIAHEHCLRVKIVDKRTIFPVDGNHWAQWLMHCSFSVFVRAVHVQCELHFTILRSVVEASSRSIPVPNLMSLAHSFPDPEDSTKIKLPTPSTCDELRAQSFDLQPWKNEEMCKLRVRA